MRRSGKYSYVDGIPCTQGWGVSARSSVSRYSASCVPGGTATTDGNVDWSGSVNGIGYLPPFPGEDPIPFIGVASAKSGEIINYEGEILISDVTITIPVAGGTPITWSANFGVQGELTKSTSTAYVDDEREPGPAGKHGKVSIETVLDSNTFGDVDQVQSISIMFRRGVATSVEDGLVYRDSGNLEADINFVVNNDDLEVAAYAPNAVNRVRIYVTPSLFYEFDSIQFSELSNFQVIRDPVTIISYQVNGMWTALRDRTPAALGEILLPGGAQLYGES